MRKLLIATGNSHKTEEIRAMLGADLYQISDLRAHPELPVVEETGTTFLENATLKAVQISRQVPGLVLSDDSGLEVDALGGAPGVYSSRYAGEEGNDEANNNKLLKELAGEKNRSARFRSVIVLAENGEVLAHFDGTVEGRIIEQKQGDAGFGYDPLFVPDGYQRSFAELGEELKNTLSHRARAVEKAAAWLAARRHESSSSNSSSSSSGLIFPDEKPACCGGATHKKRIDWLLWASMAIVAAGYVAHLFFTHLLPLQAAHFSAGVFELMNKMWWGLAIGIIAVSVLGWVPREWVAAVLGKPGTLSGILRAMGAGLILDLCNHGILLIAMKLYERGASYGQTLAFLIASPWNSLSLTLILVALIGLKWTLIFIIFSAVIAVVTGLTVESMVRAGKLPSNPNQITLEEGFKLWPEIKATLRASRMNHTLIGKMLKTGLSESTMILRWIFFGTVLAAAIRAFVPVEIFAGWFGPTWLGVLLTLVAATIIEVCSEGSTPIAADLVTRASAPGNGFAFLMAGAATDYTEIMALKETTRSWKMVSILPLLALPQVIVIAYFLNNWSSSTP